MKKFSILLCASLTIYSFTFPQGIGIGTSVPHSSSSLDITSTSKGILIPRMSTATIASIINPAKGLMVYDSVKNQLMVNMGTTASPDWQTVVAKSGWSLSGNAGTTAAGNFIGTTDYAPLVFKCGNNRVGFVGGSLGDNIFFGALAATNSAGLSNVGIGTYAMPGNVSGSYNTSIGGYSSIRTSIANNNTVMGYNAGSEWDYGWNNTFIGAYSEGAGNGAYNCIAIGKDATATSTSAAVIGNSFTNWIGGYVGWSTVSDGRYKKNVQEDVKGLDFIMKLRPVTYQLNVNGLSNFLKENRAGATDDAMKKGIDEKERRRFSGFIAQEVESSAKQLGYDFGGLHVPTNANDLYSLSYAEFVVPLTKAVQEQQVLIDAQKQTIVSLEKRLQMLEEQMKMLINPPVSSR